MVVVFLLKRGGFDVRIANVCSSCDLLGWAALNQVLKMCMVSGCKCLGCFTELIRSS
jgi:hypothetical protein